MESLISAGAITGVVDFTIKEVTDALLGGAFDAGPERMRSAGRLGYPQVVVPGAMEVLNFGPLSSVPRELRDGSRPWFSTMTRSRRCGSRRRRPNWWPLRLRRG